MAAVRIRAVAAKGSDLDGVVVAVALRSVPANRNQYHAELRAHGVRLRKQAHHVLRSGGGGYVVVLRFVTKEQIAYAAPGEICRVAMLTQGFNDACGLLRVGRREIHAKQSESRLLGVEHAFKA